MNASPSTHFTLFQLKTCPAPLANLPSGKHEEPPEGGSPHSDVNGTCQKPPTYIRDYHPRSRGPPAHNLTPHSTPPTPRVRNTIYTQRHRVKVAHFYTGSWPTFKPAFTTAHMSFLLMALIDPNPPPPTFVS